MKTLISAVALSFAAFAVNAASEPEFGGFINIKDLQCTVFKASPIDVQLSQCVEFSGTKSFIITPIGNGMAHYQGSKEGETVLGTIRYYLGAE